VNADSYFSIGKAHLVCQDYALAGSEGLPFAIVADGCSSSPDTDFGSRFLSQAALRQFQMGAEVGMICYDPDPILHEASHMSRVVGLDERCLDSTLLVAYVSEGHIRVDVTGDGVVVARRRGSEVLEHWKVEFNRGAPGYLSYILSPVRCAGFLELGLGQRTVTHSICGGEQDIEESHIGVLPYTGMSFGLDLDPEVYDLVVIASDGLQSFQHKVGNSFESIPLSSVVPHVTNIKGFKGEFMVRRMRRFLTKWCPTNGWHHNDDVAVAALHIEEPSCQS